MTRYQSVLSTTKARDLLLPIDEGEDIRHIFTRQDATLNPVAHSRRIVALY
jgi:hypothetical protein